MKLNIERIESLLNQIEQADVVVCDDSPFLNSVDVVSLVTGHEDNEILEINWHDAEGQEYKVIFTEGNLHNAGFKDNVINLCDKGGETSKIVLYSLEKNPVIKNWVD